MTVVGKLPTSGIKRCYVEGALVKHPCPTCGKECKTDLASSYLSHPINGARVTIYMFCAACDEKGDPAEFQLTAKFVVQATLSDFEVST
jgi:hypothetical protein